MKAKVQIGTIAMDSWTSKVLVKGDIFSMLNN